MEDWIFKQYVREIMDSKLKEEDYYYENGRLVFTETYHKKRGYCCGNNCRHCAYEPRSQKGNINIKDNKIKDRD